MLYYLLESKIHEIELVRELAQFPLRTNYTRHIFLLYKNDPYWIYASDGYKYTLPVYMRSKFFVNDSGELHRQILSADLPAVLFNDALADYAIFCFPIRFLNEPLVKPRAALVFMVPKTFFTTIYETYMQRFDLDFGIFIREALFFGNIPDLTERNPQEEFSDKTFLYSDSPNGIFKLVVNAKNANNNVTRFISGLGTLFPLLLLALSIGAAFILSYFAVKPVRDFIRRHGENEPDFANEIDKIEAILKKGAMQNNAAARQIRGHLLTRLLRGLSDADDEFFTLLGMAFNKPYFCLFLIPSADRLAPEDWRVSAEELSDEEFTLYTAGISSDTNYLAIIANMDVRTKRDEITALLEALLEGLNARIIMGDVVEKASELADSMASMLSKNASKTGSPDEKKKEPNITGVMDETYYLAVIKAISSGGASLALSELDRFIDDLQTSSESFLFQRYMCFDFMKKLFEWFDKNNITVQETTVFSLFGIQSLTEFKNYMNEILKKACQSFTDNQNGKTDALAHDLLNYIEERAGDPDLSLDDITERFGISANYVSLLIKKHTGVPYKNYLTGLRIDRAKKLLVEERLSVAETARRAGYYRSSNFIKKFKEITGYTPLQYKDDADAV